MALNAYTSSLTIPASTSGPVQYTESGLSGGKLLFMLSSNLGATGQANNIRMSFGCGGPGGAEAGMSFGIDHNQQNAGIGFYWDDQTLGNIPTAQQSRANLSQWIAGGFELNVAVASQQWNYDYTLLAGSDITNVAMTNFVAPTSTGVVQYTPFTFQPDALIFISHGSTSGQPTNSAFGTPGLGIGAATATDQWFVTSASAVISDATSVYRSFSDTACLRLSSHLGAESLIASLQSMLVNGFSLNYTNTTLGGQRVYVIGIKGGSPVVGTFLQPITNGIATVSMGIQPVMAVIAGAATADNTITAGGKLLLGQCSANAQRAYAVQDDNALTPASTSRRGRLLNKNKVIQNIAWSGTAWQEAGPSASLDAITGDGIDLQWFDTDATQRKFGYIAFGGTSAPPAAMNKGSLFATSLLG